MKKKTVKILIAGLSLALTACGQNSGNQGRAGSGTNNNISQNTPTVSAADAAATATEAGHTGGVNQSGRAYTDFADPQTLTTVKNGLDDNEENRKFAMQVEWAKTEFADKDILISIKWLGVDNALVFRGPLIPTDNNFSSELTEKTGLNPGLKLFVSPINNDASTIEGQIQQGEKLKARLLIHVDQKKLNLSVAPSEESLLPKATRDWVEQVKKNNVSVMRVSTAVYPGGRSFYVISLAGGSIQGDLVDTKDGPVPVQADGIFKNVATQVELIGNSGVNGNEQVFSLTAPVNDKPVRQNLPEATKSKTAVKSVETPKRDSKPLSAKPAKVFVIISDVLEQKARTAPPSEIVRPQTPPIPASPSGLSKSPVEHNVDFYDAHPFVKQILANENQPKLQEYIRGVILEGSGNKWDYHGSIPFFLACQSGDASRCRQGNEDRLNIATRTSTQLMKSGLPASWSWLAVLESHFNPFAVNTTSSAKGLWQFLNGTAADYELYKKGVFDYRTDVEKSTVGAANYLRDLIQSWNGDVGLAVLSYHDGPGTVQGFCIKAIKPELQADCNPDKIFKKNKGLNLENLKSLSTSNRNIDFWFFERTGMLGETNGVYAKNFLGGVVISYNPEKYGFSGYQPVSKK